MPKEKKEKHRLWLLFPKKLVQRPIIHELGHTFGVVTNIRQASVQDDIGLLSLELAGASQEIEKSIKWLEGLGVKVEPVEVNVIES